jgi:hypothetical protein
LEYLIMDLMYISHVGNDVEHLSMCLADICMPPW